MQKLEKCLKSIQSIIKNKNLDWINATIGYEGVGKSTLALQSCKIVDPTFSADRVVFDSANFIKITKKSQPCQSILIDEGGLLLFSRDSLRKENKLLVRALTSIRSKNLFINICIPRFEIIDPYLRKYRVRSIMRVVKRGWFWFLSPKNVKNLARNKRTGKFKFNNYSFRDSFPKLNDSLWHNYQEKKQGLFERIERKDMKQKSKNKQIKSKKELIKDLLKKTNFSNQEIAKKLNTTKGYVRKVKSLPNSEKGT